MNKLDFFQTELNYIQNKTIKEFAKSAIEKLPDYFFEIPASSTGKYHPQYATGEGGLVRHTQAAVRIAVELFTITPIYTSDERDCIIVALILHDGFKCGIKKSKYTRHEHPILMADFIRTNKEFDSTLAPISRLPELDGELLELIASCIETHMGKWTTVSYSSVVLEAPKTKYQKFTHLCDYIASRKSLEFNFKADVVYRQ